MKKNLLFTALVVLSISVFGQKLPFQGKLIESDTLVNGTRTLDFSIASPSWTETHTDVPITNGLYFIVLGSINALPDSLFYGTDEQQMEISVNGTPLSPVVLFKPLSSPFEGSELNVRNSEGTVVGTLKARTDSVKNGEFSISGEDTGIIEAGFYKANDESVTDMPYLGLQRDSNYLVSISSRKNGTSLNGSIILGSNFDESISHIQKGWFAFKDSVHTGQFQSQNWGGLGSSGYMAINGTNSINVNISSRHWENPDLPWMKLIGSENQDVIQLSAETDSLESGNINILSKNGNNYYLNANGGDVNSSTDNKALNFGANHLVLRQTGDDWREMIELTSQDWGGQGHTGIFKIHGTTSQNFELTSQSWINPNFPWFKMSGDKLHDAINMYVDNDSTETANIELFSLANGNSRIAANSFYFRGPNTTNIEFNPDWWDQPDRAILNLNGNTDENRIQLGVFEDNEQNEHGNLFLTSSNGMRINVEPRQISIKNTADPNNWKDYANMESRLTQDGISQGGNLELRGESSSTIDMGSRWDNPELPRIHLFGENNFNAMELSASRDNTGDQYGWINLMSENGKSLHLSPDGFGIEGVGMSTTTSPNGNFGSLSLNGPSSNNIQFMPDWWDKPDMGFMQVNGTGSGRVELEVNNDGNGEYGLIHLYSDFQKSIRMQPTSFAIRDDANGYHHLAEMNTHNDSGNGWAGYINLRGPNSDNFNMGIRDNNPDMPWFGLNGTNGFNLMHLTGIAGANEFGYMHLQSEDGSISNISAYRIENQSNDGKIGYFGPDRATFNDNGQEMSYNAYGISGSTPLEMFNGATVHGDFDVNGHITAVSVTETSDKRFKKNIQTIGTTLPKIELIEGVSYDWRQDEFPKKNFSSDKQIGVIAQELEAQFPALVKTDKEGYKSVNYNGFTAVLLEAVKELNAKVEKLEAKNTVLQAELSASLKSNDQIDELKQQMEALTRLVQNQSKAKQENMEELTSTQD